MYQSSENPAVPSILITDFDGTLTRHDFYELVIPRCLAKGAPDFWGQYSSGRISHFEAMKGIFSHIRCTEARIREILREMEPEPDLAGAVASLRAAGWDIIVVSNGCQWYIDQFLAAAGVDVTVVACPGRFVEGQGLLMEAPADSKFFNPGLGIDKAAVVERAMKHYGRVAFAGNGPPDLEAALMVRPEWLFARTWLADRLKNMRRPFQAFDRWAEVAQALSAAVKPA